MRIPTPLPESGRPTMLPQGGLWGSVRTKHILGRFAVHLSLITISLIFSLPFLWMISSSLKPSSEIFKVPISLLPQEIRFANYPEALQSINFLTYLGNTLVYTIFATIGAVLSNASVAYAFARMRWPGRDLLFLVVLSTMMLPFQVRMIPLYVVFSQLGWLDTLLPLIVPNFFGHAYFVFLIRQFMNTLPVELDDAARIDGCGEAGIFFRIVLPMSKPALVTVAVFHALFCWNDFLGPLIFGTNPDLYTLSIGLRLYFTMHGAEWGLLMAGASMFTLPMIILFFVAQRTFIEGIALTGLKG